MAQANFVNGSAGTIAPSVFVVFDTSGEKAVNQASASSAFIVGVSGEYSQNAPIPGASSVIATSAGDPLLVYQDTDNCYLNATTAGWTSGDRLTANASGYGIATTTSGHYYGAIALTTMSAAGLGQVKVLTGRNP